jgi:hypothetical protein
MVATWDLSVVGGSDQGKVFAGADSVFVTILTDSEPSEPDLPTEYTAIPERQATDSPPEEADFLALHHSRAADRSPGGEDLSTPAAANESEITKVRIDREQLENAAGVTFAQQVPQGGGEGSSRPEAGRGRPATGESFSEAGEMATTDGDVAESKQDETADGGEESGGQGQPEWIAGAPPSILKPGKEGVPGDRGFDFDQAALGKVEGNVVMVGDYGLNTFEWDFAPWMARFEQNLYRHWMAPYAYRLGVISGMTKVQLVVELDGRLSQIEVLESEGHDSLHQSSVAALKAFAPYWPLPPDFPEENLVIYLALHYPAWKRELITPPRTNRPSGRRGR